jgi:hypothetical protein
VPQDKPLTITPTIKIKKTATGTPSHTTFFHKSLYVWPIGNGRYTRHP